MAQVKLGQFLRRATTTLGEISATQPLETRLYGPSGEVLRTVSLGSGERGLAVVPYASDGGELFSAAKPGQVALTGRTVEVVSFFDALAIADTDPHSSSTHDLSKYRQVVFIAHSTLDKDVKVWPRFDGQDTYTWDSSRSEWRLVQELGTTLISTEFVCRFLLNTHLDMLNAPIRTIQWCAQCSEAPTRGSLTLIAWGVPN